MNGTVTSRSHNAQNEVTAVGGNSLAFDPNGNMLTDETGRQFRYDAWNRLVQVRDGSGNLLKTYSYDGLGRRITEAVNGGSTTDLYYSAGWQVLEEQVSGITTTRYVWSPVYVDALILRDRDTDANGTLDERLYALQDANFNVVALVDASGNVVERYEYDPFGQRTVLSPTYAVLSASGYAFTVGFQGMRYDSDAGLSHQRARWYSPTLGRWATNDPIGYAAGDVNLYRMEGNNPYKHVDSQGTNFWEYLANRIVCPSEVTRAQALDAKLADVMSGRTTQNIPRCGLSLGSMDRMFGSTSAAGRQAVGQIQGVAGAVVDGAASSAANSGPSIVAKTGLRIKGFTDHGVDRAIGDLGKRVGVSPCSILDALKNPLKVEDVVVDKFGRKSQRLVGAVAEVVVNPDTGMIVSLNPTSSKKAAKLLKECGK